MLADSAILASKASTPARKCMLPLSIATACQGEVGSTAPLPNDGYSIDMDDFQVWYAITA